MRRYNRPWAVVTALLLFALVAGPVAADSRHRVAPGETLWGLAQAYGVSVDALAALNKLADPDLIFVGQLLKVPGNGGGPAPSNGAPGEPYEVRPGDTLSAIAVRFGVPVESLQALNDIADPNLIVAGQRLAIPSPEPAPSMSQVAPIPLVHPYGPEVEAVIEELSAAEGVDPALVKALSWVESGWQQGVVSQAGAVGVMQITPGTAKWLEDEVFGQELNEDVSVYDNVKAGVRLLRMLLDATRDTDLAIAAYYQGYGVTKRGIMYEETKQYVAIVKAVKARFFP